MSELFPGKGEPIDPNYRFLNFVIISDSKRYKGVVDE